MNFAAVATACLVSLFISFAEAAPRPPQFVLLSFDGSLNLSFWKNIRAFSSNQIEQGRPVHFTFFASGVYFLAPAKKMIYQAPQHAKGQSAIGFGDNVQGIGERIDQVNLAFREGHEIGSHANGHFDGSSWSQSEWMSEFSQFEH